MKSHEQRNLAGYSLWGHKRVSTFYFSTLKTCEKQGGRCDGKGTSLIHTVDLLLGCTLESLEEHYKHWCLDPPWPGFPGGSSGKDPASQCRRPKRCWFDPWAQKIPWSRKWLPCIFAWRITWTEEPGRLQFISSQSTRLGMHAHTAWPLGFFKALPVILMGSKVWELLFKSTCYPLIFLFSEPSFPKFDEPPDLESPDFIFPCHFSSL